MTNINKNCTCTIEIERLSRELEAMKEELEAFQNYMLEVTDALTETGNMYLNISNDYY